VYRYRQDYMRFVEYHREKNADITVACLATDRSRASDFGLMKINDESEIIVSWDGRRGG
jgi:glucose-1-phosphate adenylyltransferase